MKGGHMVAGVQRNRRSIDLLGRRFGRRTVPRCFALADTQIEPGALEQFPFFGVALDDSAEQLGCTCKVVSLETLDAAFVYGDGFIEAGLARRGWRRGRSGRNSWLDRSQRRYTPGRGGRVTRRSRSRLGGLLRDRFFGGPFNRSYGRATGAGHRFTGGCLLLFRPGVGRPALFRQSYRLLAVPHLAGQSNKLRMTGSSRSRFRAQQWSIYVVRPTFLAFNCGKDCPHSHLKVLGGVPKRLAPAEVNIIC